MAECSKIYEELKKNLSCSVCLEIFDNPQLLPACLHSICDSCSEQLLEGRIIRCPVCRKVSNGCDVQLNFHLKQIVEICRKKMEKENVKNLEYSSSDLFTLCCLCEAKYAKKYCHGCQRLICNTCVLVHSKTTTCSEDLSENANDIVADFKSRCTIECTLITEDMEINDINTKAKNKEARYNYEQSMAHDKEKVEKLQLSHQKYKEFEKEAIEKLNENLRNNNRDLKDKNSKLRDIQVELQTFLQQTSPADLITKMKINENFLTQIQDRHNSLAQGK